MDAAARSWWEDELAGCSFADARLGQRLARLIERMDGAIGRSLPFACQDWASTKDAYRFFANQRVHTVCGLFMHASLVVTTEGLPLGLSAIKFWSRQTFKGTAALKRKINPTRVRIEHKESIRWLENLRQSMALLGVPARCVHAGDRESDIDELYTARELGTHFVVRSCVDRLAGKGRHTITDEMGEAAVQGVPGLRSATARAAWARRPSSFATCVSACCRRLASRSATPPSSSLSPMPASVTRPPAGDRLEADHGPTGDERGGGGRKAALVRDALEDRNPIPLISCQQELQP